MNKLEMAHQMALAMQSSEPITDMKLLSSLCFQYADAMQAEADKRNNKETCDKNIGLDSSVLKPSNSMELEWQPDWSQAPDNMTHFAVDANGSGWFFNREPHAESDCCWYCGDDSIELDNHNYQGNWQDSLRKRPNT